MALCPDGQVGTPDWLAAVDVALLVVTHAGSDCYLQSDGSQIEYELLVPFGQVLFFLLLFTLGAILMRGAGCTFNDLVDQNIDAKISRTRSGSISISSPISSGDGSRPSSCINFRDVRISLLIVSTMWTGILIVRAWSAIATTS